jgi:hypothetical protein
VIRLATNTNKRRNTRNSKTASMKVRVPGAKKSVDSMKYEIANEMNATSRNSKTNKKSNNTRSKKTK